MSKCLVETVPGLGRQVSVFLGKGRVPLLSRTGDPVLIPFGHEYDAEVSRIVRSLDDFDKLKVVG